MLELWRDWIAAFDRACTTDDWSGLGERLSEDVVYVVAGVPYACELRGRDAVLAGFARSVRNFDRRFDSRSWSGVGIRLWTPNAVTGRARGYYTLVGKPDLTFSAQAQWIFRDGRISVMTDLYDPHEADTSAALAWLAEHGAGLDPSYAS